MEKVLLILNIVGSVSNGIAAICAVVAIIVTVRNFKSDREEQKKEKLRFKLRELYKQVVIDSILKDEDKMIRYINDRLYKMSLGKFNESEMKEFYEYISSNEHDCLREAEMIKLFNPELYEEIKQITEHIFDTYCRIINNAMQRKYISKYWEQQIREERLKLEKTIYECYIEESFNKMGTK